MKNLVTKISALLLIGMSATSCSRATSPPGVQLQAEVDGSTITLGITNASPAKVVLVNPTDAVIPGQNSGVDVYIADGAGRRVPICAMVEPVKRGDMDRVVDLEPGSSISQKFDMATLGRRFCLKAGRYKTHFILKQATNAYSSNEIMLVVN